MTFKRIQALQIKSWLHLLLHNSLKQFSIMRTQMMITGASTPNSHPLQHQSTRIYTMKKDFLTQTLCLGKARVQHTSEIPQ